MAERRETGVLAGHTGTIAALECQGKVLISAGYDTTVRIWSITDHVAGLETPSPRVSRPSPIDPMPRSALKPAPNTKHTARNTLTPALSQRERERKCTRRCLVGLWSLLTGRRKKDIPTVDARRLRRGRFESLEDRRLMDADPLKIGVTYHEEDSGSDLHGDRFEILFEGGASGTELTQLVINGDHGPAGLSVTDMIFDTIKGGLGADEAFNLQVISSTGIQDVSWQVTDGGIVDHLQLSRFQRGREARLHDRCR